MKKKLLAYAILPVLGLGILSIGVASAHGLGGFGMMMGFGPNLSADEIATRQQTMFEKQATLLGVSADDVKNAWADGKSLLDLATEKGITKEQLQAKLKDGAVSQLKTQLQTLVSKGIITQAQADKRLQLMQTQVQNSKSFKGHGFHMMGFGF